MGIVGTLLDNDWYVFTMSSVIRRNWPDTVVGYSFINRHRDFPLARYVDPVELRDEIEALRSLRLTVAERRYLRSLGLFGDADLAAWESLSLPEVHVDVDGDQLRIETEGRWADAVFLETPMLAIVTESVSRALAAHAGLGQEAVRRNGHRTLDDVVAGLRTHPGLRFAQFGARRRFSRAWEYEVTARIAHEVPDRMVGIADVALAREFGYPTSGTMAHQLEMVVAALARAAGEPAPLDAATVRVLDAWEAAYASEWNGGLLTALPDTFGTGHFLRLLTPERASRWRAYRQDSGEPRAFAVAVTDRLRELGHDPRHYRVIHTDALDLPTMVDLHAWSQGRYQVGFGWGTKLTNNVGVATHSLVWKPSYVLVDGRPVPCVKLSDDLAKAVGDPATVAAVAREAGHPGTRGDLPSV